MTTIIFLAGTCGLFAGLLLAAQHLLHPTVKPRLDVRNGRPSGSDRRSPVARAVTATDEMLQRSGRRAR